MTTGANTPDLATLARSYAAAADAEHRAKLARIEARDLLLSHAPAGFELAGVRVSKRSTWKLTPEGSKQLAAARAEIIEAGEAERVTALVAIRIGRED